MSLALAQSFPAAQVGQPRRAFACMTLLVLAALSLSSCRSAAPETAPAGDAGAPPSAAALVAATPSAGANAAINDIDALVTAGELDQALTVARHWSELEPNVAELQFALGLVTRSKLSVEAAEPAFERALALRPRQAAWLRVIADGHIEAGDPATAERYLGRVLEIDPYDGPAAAALGALLIERGEDEAALAALVPAEGSGVPEVFAGMGLAYRNLGRDEEAERYLRRAADLDPRNLEVLLALGQLLQRMGNAEEGARYLDSLERLSAEADALDFAERSSQVEGASAANFMAVGETRRKQGDLSGAAEAYRQASARDPANPAPWIGQATIALSRRDHAALLEFATQAATIDPNHAQAQLLLGLGLIRAGQGVEGEAALARSRELSRWMAIQWDMSAQAYADVGLLGPAAEAYAQAHALEPDNGPLALRLGVAHLLRGDAQAAHEVLSVAAARLPTDGDLALADGLALDRLGLPTADAALDEAAARYAAAGVSPATAAARFRAYPGTQATLARFEERAAR